MQITNLPPTIATGNDYLFPQRASRTLPGDMGSLSILTPTAR